MQGNTKLEQIRDALLANYFCNFFNMEKHLTIKNTGFEVVLVKADCFFFF